MELKIHLSYELTLEKLLKEIPQVKTAVIATLDGIPVASTFTLKESEVRIAALTAALHCLSEKTVNEMKGGDFNLLCINSTDRSLIVLKIDSDSVLFLIVDKLTELGALLNQIKCLKVNGFYPFSKIFKQPLPSSAVTWVGY